jgi:hypothetical protein
MSDTLGLLTERNLLEVFGQRGDKITVLLLQRGSLEVARSVHEEFERRIKTQTVLPSADTAAMLFWAPLASGQINMRKVDGWQTLATKPIAQSIDLAA